MQTKAEYLQNNRFLLGLTLYYNSFELKPKVMKRLIRNLFLALLNMEPSISIAPLCEVAKNQLKSLELTRINQVFI